MHLLLGQLIREELIWRVKDAKWFSILVDEVTDCASIEQLLIYVGYVDEEGKPHFDFLESFYYKGHETLFICGKWRV